MKLNSESKKICFLGNAGVGKTTLIKLLITGTFTKQNEKVLKENIVIDPKKFGIKYYKYPIELIDGSGLYEKEDYLNLVRDCNVVVLMYDFINSESLDKIKSDYIPALTQLDNIYSIFVVGNKIDLLDINSQKFVIEQEKSDIEKFALSLETNLKYFHISCKNYYEISNLLSEILDSLVNPIRILFQKNRESDGKVVFSDKFEKAIKRVFRIFDKDRKGFITKQEFNKIHENIFNIKLESDHFYAIKECIKIINPNKPIGFNNDDSITFDGFLSLNKLTCQVGESQTAWSTLRKFGYNDEFELDNWYFKSKKLYNVDTNQFIVEFTENAKNLLTDVFNQFKSKDSISEKEWGEIFATCSYNSYESQEFSFDKIFRSKTIKLLTCDEWIILWKCFIRINHSEAFKIFLYMGFDLDFDNFAKVINRSNINLSISLEQKTVHVCFISVNEDSINNFLKYFNNFYTIIENKNNTKQINFIIKSAKFSIIVL
jgi:Ras family protein T1